MKAGPVQGRGPMQFELRFSDLFHPGRGYSFPCVAQGCVDLDDLSDSLRSHYLFARALVGHELSAPVTCAWHGSTSMPDRVGREGCRHADDRLPFPLRVTRP
jgi:hypothetical protein